VTSADTSSSPLTAVVLCGGAARRFGSDKTRADLAGSSLLDHLLDGLPGAWPVICVGASRPTRREVGWCREDPPGGGPVAAVSAALPLVDGAVIVLLGGDMPYAAEPARDLAARLLDTPDVDAVVARDGDGRLQPLLAAYRTGALLRTVPADPAGTPLMRLLDPLRILVVPVEGAGSLDVDTAEDLERARHRLDP
jgi:molybdopterin-guanine dinucleotide biosynthesis protein A